MSKWIWPTAPVIPRSDNGNGARFLTGKNLLIFDISKSTILQDKFAFSYTPLTFFQFSYQNFSHDVNWSKKLLLVLLIWYQFAKKYFAPLLCSQLRSQLNFKSNVYSNWSRSLQNETGQNHYHLHRNCRYGPASFQIAFPQDEIYLFFFVILFYYISNTLIKHQIAKISF